MSQLNGVDERALLSIPASKDSADLDTATEAELLVFAVRYLERVKAHKRLVWAVTRAAVMAWNRQQKAVCQDLQAIEQPTDKGVI